MAHRAVGTKSRFVSVLRVPDKPLTLVFGRVSGLAFSLVSAPLLARALEPADRGLYAALIAILGVTAIVIGLGVPIAVRVEHALGRGDAAIRASRVASLLSIPACAALSWVGGKMIVGLPDGTAAAMIFGGAAAAGSIALGSDGNYLFSARRYRNLALVQLAPVLLNTAGIAILWSIDKLNLAAAVWCYGISITLPILISQLFVRVSLAGERTRMAPLYREGLRYFGSQLGETLGQRLPLLVAVPVIGAVGTGYLAVALTLVAIPVSLGQAISSNAFSVVAQLSANEARNSTIEIMRQGVLCALVATCALIAVTPLAVPLIFGSAYGGAVAVCVIALASSVFMAPQTILVSMLTARRRGRLVSITQILGAGTTTTSLIILGSYYGSAGAAMAVGIGNLFTMITLCAFSRVNPVSIAPRFRDIRPAVRLVTTNYNSPIDSTSDYEARRGGDRE